MSRRTLFLTLALPSLLVGMSIGAQPASRVKDIDPGGNSTWPLSLTVAGGRLFFVADDGPHGTELWTSDGTGPGTTRVPGTSGIWTVFAGNAGAYFFKDGGGLGNLWRSDGTVAGTSLVKAGVGLAMESAVAGALTFFSNSRLWRTDGTPAGTYQLFGNDGQEPVNVQQLTASNGILYFFAAGSSLVDTLWRSDGTAAGTFAVPLSPLSVSLPSYSSLRPMIGPFDARFFFGAFEATHGLELWASDGTDPGTSLFRDLEPGSGPSNPQQFTRSGGRLFFVANTPSVGWRIWSTDGNPANTAAVDSFVGGFRSIAGLTDVSGRLAFQTLGYGIWTSDGTNAGTVRLMSGNAANLTAVGPRVFFAIPFGQLWTSDLTPGGTHLVRSFGNSLPRSLTAFGGLLYFFADDGVSGPQLWKSDGTAGGTSLVAILRPGITSSAPSSFQEVNGAAYFLAANGIWKSDGTETGTTPVLTGLTLASTLTATRRKLFWVEGFGAPPFVLKMSDGTPAGTGPVPVPANISYVEQPVCTADTVFFFGTPQSGDKLLWAADGTPAGTRSLGIFSGPSAPGTPAGVPVPLGKKIVFLLSTASAFVGDLWQSDGTPSGTSRVKLLSTRFGPQCTGLPHRLGRAVVFLADDGYTGCNVWRSDATAAGTVPVGVVGGGGNAQMSPLGSARGFLAFTNFTDLWRTDGTPAGTFLLESFTAAALATPPGVGTREGVYFAVQTNGSPDTTQELWITDGSVAGTVLLHDFKAGGADLTIVSLTTANGRLLATIRGAYPFPMSLWTSDGTPSGTVKVQDNAGAGAESLPFRGVTLFAGTDPWAGTELWAMDGVGFIAPVRPAALSVLTPCRVLDTRLTDDFLGGPALSAGAPRVFPVGGVCGIPGTARSIAANVTVTNATADGVLRIHASDIGAPDATVINFRSGQTRANNATIALGPDAEFTVRFEASAGTGDVHVIVDVVGFFE